ncbi:MAG: 4-(cytidine 5'-diphospho)-2-C-methyl-D-erythritol kinase [Gemmatimonadales bacterium]|nr:MAG: 4-(cytidine 5'-diphospho)-2-C-methyl-D-erythritol kinase [Gemmatimonadales bacterium]
MSLPRRVRVEARAKLNLGLAVGPRRSDGFHELATIFQSVNLADTLVAERRMRGFSIEVRHEEAAARGALSARARGAVPPGRGNLALRAARLAVRYAGIEGGVHLHLTKRIPAQAGLGGGSADAAAALVAVFALYGVEVPLADRLALGMELGADVPFALLGGTALGLGRGEQLTRLKRGRSFRAVIAVPRWRTQTAEAFRKLDQSKNGLTGWNGKLRFAKAAGGMGLWPYRALRLGNSFEAVLGTRMPDFVDLCARLREAGVREPHLTGSGSAVFGLLGPRVLARCFLDRFRGSEALYVVRLARSGLGIRR